MILCRHYFKKNNSGLINMKFLLTLSEHKLLSYTISQSKSSQPILTVIIKIHKKRHPNNKIITHDFCAHSITQLKNCDHNQPQ